MSKTIIDTFKAARRVSAPLLAIKTPDPSATIHSIMESYGVNCPPVLVWDCVRGAVGWNKEGQAMQPKPELATEQAVYFLQWAVTLEGATEGNPRGPVVFMMNAHRWISDAVIAQAVWNLRDKYKQNRRTLVMMMPEGNLPLELANDTVVLDEPLPSEEALGAIVQHIGKASGKEKELGKVSSRAVDATIGLPAFAAEQTIAMSLDNSGLDIEGLWERKRKMIEATAGLKVWSGDESFDGLGGLANIKAFLNRFLNGKKRPRVIVFIDEIEKALAGIQGDTSGTSQDQLGSLLTFMQNERCDGMLLLGPAGTGKSQLTKAAGNEGKVPVVELDLGGMKGSLVGESEGKVRAALKTIKAMGKGRILFVATCNSEAILPPELRRRFKSGTFFMDLPTASEREVIWKHYLAKFGLAKGKGLPKLPADNGWTGAEIETCCQYASDFGVDISEAAQYIVPVSKAAPEVIEKLRQGANGRYLSASTPGLYSYEPESNKAKGRALSSTEEEV